MNTKHMTEISEDNKGFTLINVFTVEPQNQERLVKILEKATEEIMRNLNGFVSANIHRSLDGVRVVNYANGKARKPLKICLKTPRH